MEFRTYKIDFTHIIWGTTKTINLADTKDKSIEQAKNVVKRFSFWWKKSLIYC